MKAVVAGQSVSFTIDLLGQGAATTVAVIRGLSDEQLAKSGTIIAGAPPMTVEQLITAGLLAHIDDHFGSIRKTITTTSR
jgi:hypothetical protein